MIYLNIAGFSFRSYPNMAWDIFITKKLVIVNSDAKLSSSDESWKGSRLGYLKNGEQKQFVNEMGGYADAIFWKMSPPIWMLYVKTTPVL